MPGCGGSHYFDQQSLHIMTLGCTKNIYIYKVLVDIFI